MENDNPTLKTAVDITIKIGVLLLVIFFLFQDPAAFCEYPFMGACDLNY